MFLLLVHVVAIGAVLLTLGGAMAWTGFDKSVTAFLILFPYVSILLWVNSTCPKCGRVNAKRSTGVTQRERWWKAVQIEYRCKYCDHHWYEKKQNGG